MIKLIDKNSMIPFRTNEQNWSETQTQSKLVEINISFKKYTKISIEVGQFPKVLQIRWYFNKFKHPKRHFVK